MNEITYKAYCMKCQKVTALLNVKQDGAWWDGRPKFIGGCETCGLQSYRPLAPKDENKIRKQHIADKNMADLHEKAMQAAQETRGMRHCPHCYTGVMVKVYEDQANPLNDDIKCVSCGYSGVTINVPEGFLLTKSKAKR